MENKRRSALASELNSGGIQLALEDDASQILQRTSAGAATLPELSHSSARAIRKSLSGFMQYLPSPLWGGATELANRKSNGNESAEVPSSDVNPEDQPNAPSTTIPTRRRRARHIRSSTVSEEDYELYTTQQSSVLYEELSRSTLGEFLRDISYDTSDNMPQLQPHPRSAQGLLAEGTQPMTLGGEDAKNGATGSFETYLPGYQTDGAGSTVRKESERVDRLPVDKGANELSHDPEWIAISSEDIPQSLHDFEGSRSQLRSNGFAVNGPYLHSVNNTLLSRTESVEKDFENDRKYMGRSSSDSLNATAGHGTNQQNLRRNSSEETFQHREFDLSNPLDSRALPLGLDGEFDLVAAPQDLLGEAPVSERMISTIASTTLSAHTSPFAGFLGQKSHRRESLVASSTVKLSKESACMKSAVATASNKCKCTESINSGDDNDYMTKGVHNLRQLEEIARELDARSGCGICRPEARFKGICEDDEPAGTVTTERYRPNRRQSEEIAEDSLVAGGGTKLPPQPAGNNRNVTSTTPDEPELWQEIPSASNNQGACCSSEASDFTLKAPQKSVASTAAGRPTGRPITRYNCGEPSGTYHAGPAPNTGGEKPNRKQEKCMKHVDRGSFREVSYRTTSSGRPELEKDQQDEAMYTETKAPGVNAAKREIDNKTPPSPTKTEQISWGVNITKQQQRTSNEINDTNELPDLTFEQGQNMPPATQANAFYYLVTDQSDLQIFVKWREMPNSIAASTEEDYRVLRSLLETISGPRYWVFDVEELQCETCMEELRVARSRKMIHSIAMTAKSISAKHKYCSSCHYDFTCRHETRIGRLFGYIGASAASRMQYVRFRSHGNNCIDSDHLASAVEILKERLPGLISVKVDLHPPGYECHLDDKQSDKQLVCSLQELQRLLPPKSRLVVSEIDNHKELEKRWRSVRRGWHVGANNNP